MGLIVKTNGRKMTDKISNKIVLVFDADEYEREDLDVMSNRELYETYLNDDEFAVRYDSVYDFFNELNDGLVGTENNWVYIVEID